MTYIIGVDGGGSKTHGLLFDQAGKVIDEASSGPCNIRNDLDSAYAAIINVIDELINKNNLDENIRIGIGVAGYSVKANRENLIKKLNHKYTNYKLESDCHIACLAAHGGKDGAIIICGTGVVGYCMRKGVGYQTGGWGFPHGDLGGGAWFGLEMCRLLCKAIDGIIPWSASLYNIFSTYFENDYSVYKTWLLEAKPNNYAAITKLVLNDNYTDNYVQILIDNGVYEIECFIKAFLKSESSLDIKLVGGLSNIYIKRLSNHFPKISISEAKPSLGARFLF